MLAFRTDACHSERACTPTLRKGWAVGGGLHFLYLCFRYRESNPQPSITLEMSKFKRARKQANIIRLWTLLEGYSFSKEFFFFIVANIQNTKLTILTILSVYFDGVKYFHSVLSPSPLSISRTFYLLLLE